MKTGLTYDQDGNCFKNVRARQSEEMFKYISQAAGEQGLQVNSKKTALLAISGARSYTARTHIYDAQDNRIDSSSTLKTLGFTFNSSATVSDQIEILVNKMSMRTWTLRELANGGFTEKERLEVYKTMIRPIVEYSSVVYNSMLTKEQEKAIENVQTRALKSIYGYVYTKAQVLQMSGLETLAERRERACHKFAVKLANNPRFAGWFPKRKTRARTGGDQNQEYVEYQARTDRRKNSPLFYYRRLLNNNRVNYDVRQM